MKLPQLLRAWRFREEMTLRDMAKLLHMPEHTYARLEKGAGIGAESLATIIRWMMED